MSLQWLRREAGRVSRVTKPSLSKRMPALQLSENNGRNSLGYNFILKVSSQLIFLNYWIYYIIWSRSFATQALSRTDNKNDKIDYLLKSLSLSKILSPAKLLRPLTLLHSAPHPSTRFTATEASVLVLKMTLSSAQTLFLSSISLCILLLLSSAFKVSLLCSRLTVSNSTAQHSTEKDQSELKSLA